MKKISEKKIMTYVILAGLVMFIAVYFLIYQKYNEKAATLEAGNATLNERVMELKQFFDDMDNNKKKISAMQEQVQEWLAEFPADVKEEDIIAMALETEKNAAVAYSNINIADREALRTIPAATVCLSGMENLTQDLIFVKRLTSYVNSTDYPNMKNVIQTINDSHKRLSISKITYSMNEETGLLDGTVEVTFYSVTGDGKEYVPQKLMDYQSGLPDLFGDVQPKSDSDSQE